MMTDTLKTPEFASDQEAAEWFDRSEEELLGQFEQAARDGTLVRGTMARDGQIPKTSIRLDPADIELAKAQAEKRGLRFQSYLKMIIHERLLQEAGIVSTS